MTKLTFLTCALIIASAAARDADNLYDTCPAANATAADPRIFINGLPCKDPSDVAPSDFKSTLLSRGGDTNGFFRSSTTVATAAEFAGLNTLGLSAARTDIDVDGIVMPHAHPRAAEMVYVSAGVVVAGFLDSGSRVFQKRLEEGDVFVFPKGLLHFCFNFGFEKATLFSVLNSQSPGLLSITGNLFGRDGRERLVEKLRSLKGRDFNEAADLFVL
ncbi:germin-like protein subfamily 3 member 4 [Andrographis paniculata]|uniref:germin-like protein subfamily 3 member 4 n=1 Tax=Andrographis paniculata TaxID=175694 RepID=UPI0021E8F25C|nr:germin-like protein subfamily 3 member 4 [Andrographis paniculata]